MNSEKYPDLHILGVILVALAAYAATLPRTITLEDAGLFQLVCHQGGIGHPPGYPLFVLACQQFVQIPIFPQGVFAGNFLSSVFAALSVGVLFLIARQLFRSLALSYLMSLSYAFSATFWSQAIIIEVYSLAALTYLLCCWQALRFYQEGTEKALYWLAFCYGLALSNHWPLIGLSTPALMVLVFARWDRLSVLLLSVRCWMILLLLLLLGLSPYLSLATQTPGMSIYGPVDSLERFVWYITRAPYADTHEAAVLVDKAAYIGWLMERSANQLGLVLLPIVLIGFVGCFRLFPVPVATSFLVLYLGTTMVLAGMMSFDFTPLFRAVFEPYPIVAYVSVCFWFACGCRVCWNWLRDRLGSPFWPAGLSAALILSVFGSNLWANDRHSDTVVETIGLGLLKSLPPSTVLFLEGDFEHGVLGWLYYQQNVRPDIEMRSWDNLVFPNRLAGALVSSKEKWAARLPYIQSAHRQVISRSPDLTPNTSLGSFYRYEPANEGSEVVSNPALGPVIDYLLDLDEEALITDPHQQFLTETLLLDFARHYVALELAVADLSPAELKRIERIHRTFFGQFARMELLLAQPQSARFKLVLLEATSAAEARLRDHFEPGLVATFYQHAANVYLLPSEDAARAIAYLDKSLTIYPARSNPALSILQKNKTLASSDAGQKWLMRFDPGLKRR